MQLAFDLRTLDDHFPGIARYGYELALALLRLPAGPQLSVILPATPRTRFDLTPLLAGAQVVRSDAAVFGLRQHWEIGRIIRDLGADVALFPYYVRPLWTSCPAITVVYDAISWRVPELFSPLKRVQIRVLHHLALARSAAICTMSRSAAADLVQFYSLNPARLSLTSGGVSRQFSPRPAPEIAAFRAAHSLPERYIVYLASDKPHKNIPLLLNAWAAANTGAVGLVLAGRWFDPATERLLDRDPLRGRVWRLPAVAEADLPTLYSGALALAFPSRYEGFGLPPLEALACGTPVLAARTSSLPEVVGDAGVLLPLEPGAWTSAIEAICHNPAHHADLTQRARPQAARFRWDDTARQVYATSLGCLERASSSRD
ncbi:MAG: glycosyltransferase family 4 protein [Herpetosiphonaceae bacterium]|nr:glycosyltransferase family 4 protein [Herpetosiphonaceae bacterium]